MHETFLWYTFNEIIIFSLYILIVEIQIIVIYCFVFNSSFVSSLFDRVSMNLMDAQSIIDPGKLQVMNIYVSYLTLIYV